MTKKKVMCRVFSLLLATVLMIHAGSLVSFASSFGRIDGFSEEHTLEEVFSLGQSGDYDDLEVRPGDEIRIPLTADMFTWSTGRTPLPLETLRMSEAKRDIRVRTRKQAGSVTLDYVQLETDVFAGKPFFAAGSTSKTGKTTYISVMFAEEFVSTKDQNFVYDIDLLIDGKTNENYTITLTGKMMVDLMEFDAGTDYIYMAEGIVAEATDSVRGVSFDLGQGVVVKKNTQEGKKYYATCSIKYPYDAGFEEDFPEVYPVMDFVYALKTVNMREGGGGQVTLTPPGDVEFYYVYGDDMRYLGTSKETLPFSEYYFMCKEKVPTLELAQYESDLSEIPNWDQNTGNSNFNPNTGR
ncbi:hypothetical protein U6B65_06180 [Oscillospiraceae bacterium MB08-C2-2]|nr:hypothetical protein U6B65_06180 [Oscillospiraceae bacterium MB08-C2-2]